MALSHKPIGVLSAVSILVAANIAAAQVAPPAPVEQSALAKDPFATGTLTPATGALGSDLWRGSDRETVAYLLATAPARPSAPSVGEALRVLLLSPAEPIDGGGTELGGRKLLALTRAGFVNEARTIASLSNAPRNDPHVGEALALADLYDGAIENACRRNTSLSSGRDEAFWVKLRVLCYAAAGERDAADLTFAILRERGLLSDTDEVLLNAVATGAPPKTPAKPQNGLHLAALRMLGAEPAAGLLGEADGGVLKAIAGDDEQEPATRITAAQAAVAMGVMNAAEVGALYASMPLDMADVAAAAGRAQTAPDDPMTDVVLYRLIAQMTAPEFMRDKAARIADALGIASTFPRAYASAVLYGKDIEALQGALVSPGEAMRFAEARMAVGDVDGAATWLSTVIASGGVGSLPEDEQMTFIGLADLLSALDQGAAESLADRAGVALGATPRSSGRADEEALEGDMLARLVGALLEAVREGGKGQAGLAAIAALEHASDPVAAVVAAHGLEEAGLAHLAGRARFENAWRESLDRPAPQRGLGTDNGAQPQTSDDSSPGLSPRLKPPRS